MIHRDSPIVCLVTDRTRLVSARDDIRTASRRLAALTREAVDAGVDLIQVRERDLEAAPLVEVVQAIVDAARGSPTMVVVNDRLDVAIACRTKGVHLRSDSFAVADARSIVSGEFLIGRSVHGAEEAARDASDADYVIAGTVFSTTSKPGADRLLGEAGLAQVVKAVRAPVLAIGGMTLERVAAVAASGAAGIAGIGLFLQPRATLAQIVKSTRARFDSVISAVNIRHE